MTTTVMPEGWTPDPSWTPDAAWLAKMGLGIGRGEESMPEELSSRHLPGAHDQKSHGRGGGSGKPDAIGEAVAEELVGKLRSEGGFTYHAVDAHSPKSGTMVSPYPKRTVKVAKERLTADHVIEFGKANADLLVEKQHYIGAWEEKGNVYLDVSVRTPTVQAARDLNRDAKANQIAAWDLTHGGPVQLGGTGEA